MAIFKAVQWDQQDSVPIGAWQTDIKGGAVTGDALCFQDKSAEMFFYLMKN